MIRSGQHCFCGIALLAIIGSDSSNSAGESKPEKPWSFLPLSEKNLPPLENKAWPRQQIDHFILAGVESAGLKPAPQADSRTLIRRLYFDLIGLPPTPEQVAAFDGDVSAAVEELLESPHYGERWGRHWLDLARYTDTTASWLESTAAAWLYRDWVVQAINDDVPYDEFVKRQLATDLIAKTDPKDNAALGFLGLSPTYWKELQLPPELIKGTVADEWEERVDAFGKTFLGLTLGCARCHDHKNDPVTARDYYAIAGVFASVKLADRPTMSDELWAPVAKARAEVAKLEKQIADLKKKKPAPEDLEAQTKAIQGKVAAIKKATPHYDVPMVNGVEEAALFVKKKDDGKHGTKLDYTDGKPRDLPLHMRGDPNTVGDIVPRGFLSAFPVKDGKPRHFTKGSGRLELAESIVEEAAPLSARVIVNRVWRHHFGRGLVETPSDFGFGGEPPSHPELLDDLAARFIENSWSFKWLHREILNSATWQQASISGESEEVDPGNRLLARMPRHRLSVEAWRDSMLAATNQLDRSIGGDAIDLTKPENKRRTIYGKIHRRELNQMLRLHDFPDPTAHNPKRPETTTPLQLLFTLNGPFIQQQSEALAKRLVEEVPESADERIDLAYQLLFQRKPNEQERTIADQFLGENARHDGSVWARYAQALLGSNEFLFVD